MDSVHSDWLVVWQVWTKCAKQMSFLLLGASDGTRAFFHQISSNGLEGEEEVCKNKSYGGQCLRRKILER